MLTVKSFLVRLTKIPKPLVFSCLLPLPLILSAMQLLTMTSLQDLIDQKTYHPLVFQIRNMIHPGTLNPRIKVFAFDDRTVAAIKSQDIPLNDWANVISQVSKKRTFIYYSTNYLTNLILPRKLRILTKDFHSQKQTSR